MINNKEVIITEYPGFIHVKAAEDNKSWEKIHQDIVKERGAEYKPKKSNNRIRFLLKEDEGNAIGVVEMLPYLPEIETNIDAYFPFSTNSEVCQLREKKYTLFEIGKLGIIPENRNSGILPKFIDFIFKFSQDNNIDYILCAMNIEIYYFLVLNSKIVFNKLGKKLDFGPYGTYPVIIDIKTSLERWNSELTQV